MSNASNLSTLANVLDDGTSGQFLKSTGSGGVAFDTVAAGAVVYATADLLPLSGNSAGDMAYVTATNRFYINNGSGWYSVSLVNTNPNITSVQDASSNTTPFTLATDGTATVITVTAADPEEVPLTYGYSVTSGSLNGSTVTQGTGSNSNVFTVTPHASQDATFTITFTASDGINQATSANEFSLSFITIVADSNHTTLLATATGTSDNNNITDSSSNNYSITVTGDTSAGTFSPYRSGGYSTYFDGSDYLQLSATATDLLPETSNTTIEAWVNTTGTGHVAIFSNFNPPSPFNGMEVGLYNGYQTIYSQGSWINNTGGTGVSTINDGSWHHLAWVISNSGTTVTTYVDGVQNYTSSITASTTGSSNQRIGASSNSTVNRHFTGYISDVRFVKGTAITPASGGPTERLTAVTNTQLLACHLPYIADGSTNDHSITVNGDVSTKPFSPYDYEEYSATDHGGSVYFDGNGDTLEIPHSTNVGAFGTNDFTVQLWYYTEAINNQDYLIDFRQYGANGDYLSISKNGSNKIVVAEGGSNRITGTKDISLGQWFFITVHRDSGSLKLFVNGEQDGSTYSDSTNYVAGSSGNFIIGKNNGSASYLMQGYLSDIRVTHGSALDGTTVPTAPLSSTGAELHIKGTDASIIDKSQGSNLKLVGNTTGSTDEVRTGNWANTKTMKFDGTTDYIISQEPVLLGTQDFTAECWLYYQSGLELMGNRLSNGSGGFSVRITSTSITVGNSSGTGFGSVFSGTTSSLTNAWHHIAVSRSSGVTKIYVDGSSIASHSSAIDFSLSNPFVIGYAYSNGSGAASIQGYIQDFRVTIGKSRYTANFTPPSAPLEG